MSTMTHVEVTCPGCSRTLRVRREYLGRRAQCKYCEATLTIAEGDPTPHRAIQPQGASMYEIPEADRPAGLDAGGVDPSRNGNAEADALRLELEALRDRLASAEADRESGLGDLDARHEQELANLRDRAEAERARLDRELEAIRSEADGERSRLVAEADALRDEADELRAEADRERARLADELQSLRDEADRRIADLSDALEAARAEAEAEQTRLEADLRSLRDEKARLRGEGERLRDEVARLKDEGARLLARAERDRAEADRERLGLSNQLDAARAEAGANARDRDAALVEIDGLRKSLAHVEAFAQALERNRNEAEAHYRAEVDRLAVDLQAAYRRGEAEARRGDELAAQSRGLQSDLDALAADLGAAREALDLASRDVEAAAEAHERALAGVRDELGAAVGRHDALRVESERIAASRDALHRDFAAAQTRVESLNRRLADAQRAGSQIRGLLRRVGVPLG